MAKDRTEAPARAALPALSLNYVPPKKGEAQGMYVGRLPALVDGSRPWVRIRAPRSPQAEERARERALAMWERAIEKKQTGADFGIKRRGPSAQAERPTAAAPTAGARESVADWFDRYFLWREKKGHVTVDDSRARVGKWVEPVVGKKAVTEVTREHIETIVRDLDGAIRLRAEKGKPHGLTWKSAFNVWSDVTSAFKAACTSKEPGLRVLERSPTENVQGPDRGNHRDEPFLYPSEVIALLSCEDVPIYWRETYAVAIYTGARSNELAALTAADVDFEHMKISISKQVDRRTGDVKDQTKTKRARPIDIEPHLLPLLRRLVKRAGEEKLLRMPPDEDRARLLRKHVKVAGCARSDLEADDAMRAPLKFHGLRHTCLTHMAVRGDEPLRIQWRAGHTTFAMTEKYISLARNVGHGFGAPLPPLPAGLLRRVQPRPAVQMGKKLNDSATPTGIEESETAEFTGDRDFGECDDDVDCDSNAMIVHVAADPSTVLQTTIDAVDLTTLEGPRNLPAVMHAAVPIGPDGDEDWRSAEALVLALQALLGAGFVAPARPIVEALLGVVRRRRRFLDTCQ